MGLRRGSARGARAAQTRHARRGRRLDPRVARDSNPGLRNPRKRFMVRPDPLDAPAPHTSPVPVRAIRRRLMERVADADASHLTIDGDEGDWQPFLEGVTIKVLREHEGVLSYLLRLEPGARLPPHRHPHDEECIVLAGRLRVGSHLEVGPGGYHLAHRGALHPTISSETGATIFLRGAEPGIGQVLE